MVSVVAASPQPRYKNGNKRRVCSRLKRSRSSSSDENRRLSKMMKPVEGAITRKNSITARCTRRLIEGLKVVSSAKPALFWRCGRKNAGDPIQAESSRNASAGLAGGPEIGRAHV